jgi:hypothetical protein
MVYKSSRNINRIDVRLLSFTYFDNNVKHLFDIALALFAVT